MGVHFNRYPNPTTVNENVNAGFGSFSTVSLVFSSGLRAMREWEYGGLPFFILTLNVSLFQRDDVPYLSSFFFSMDNKKASSLKMQDSIRIINDSMLGFAISF